MDEKTREDVRQVLRRFGVDAARRVVDTDNTEELIFVSESVYRRIDVEGLTRALMGVLPHKKVWVAPNNPRSESEPI
jgi:hypothetical protein